MPELSKRPDEKPCRLGRLCFSPLECQVGDYIFHLRGRMDDWEYRRDIYVPKDLMEIFLEFHKDPSQFEVPKVRAFHCGWTKGGVKVWVRTA